MRLPQRSPAVPIHPQRLLGAWGVRTQAIVQILGEGVFLEKEISRSIPVISHLVLLLLLGGFIEWATFILLEVRSVPKGRRLASRLLFL